MTYINFIYQATLKDKSQLQEFVKIFEHEKIDITFYESLTLLLILNFNLEQITGILKKKSSSSIKEFIDGVVLVYNNDERNFNLLRDKILLLKFIFYALIYQRSHKYFFESIKYENSNDKYKILQHLILNHNISLKESVLYQNLLQPQPIQVLCKLHKELHHNLLGYCLQ